ncbi:uncharacterized protein LOC134723258 [Mytilus trossulus]|uniref:uncharacterized protein LOC134723258 n=1 Tax=Mytilus trossulus TaxID=6551 RepID=UPI0030052CDF
MEILHTWICFGLLGFIQSLLLNRNICDDIMYVDCKTEALPGNKLYRDNNRNIYDNFCTYSQAKCRDSSIDLEAVCTCVHPMIQSPVTPVSQIRSSQKFFTTMAAASSHLVSSTVKPTMGPLTVKPTMGPLTVKSTMSPLTVKSTMGPLTVKSTMDPLTVKSTVVPLTVKSTMGPTTVKPTVGPLTVKSTMGPVTVKPTMDPLTVKPTKGPLTVKSTMGLLTVQSTMGPLTVKSTMGTTTVKPTMGPLTVKSTMGPTTVKLTMGPPTQSVTTPDAIISVFCQNSGVINCSSDQEHMCGSDNTTYKNRCEFTKAQCVNPNLSIVREGDC